MAADVLKTSGFHVIYLGIDVPVDSLIQTIAAHQPVLTGLSLTIPRPHAQVTALIDAVSAAHPDTHLLIGGQGVPEWLRDDRVTYVAQRRNACRTRRPDIGHTGLKPRAITAACRAGPWARRCVVRSHHHVSVTCADAASRSVCHLRPDRR